MARSLLAPPSLCIITVIRRLPAATSLSYILLLRLLMVVLLLFLSLLPSVIMQPVTRSKAPPVYGAYASKPCSFLRHSVNSSHTLSSPCTTNTFCGLFLKALTHLISPSLSAWPLEPGSCAISALTCIGSPKSFISSIPSIIIRPVVPFA